MRKLGAERYVRHRLMQSSDQSRLKLLCWIFHDRLDEFLRRGRRMSDVIDDKACRVFEVWRQAWKWRIR